jgi:hypothetical protein
MEWERTNEEDERADAARQTVPDADGPAELQTPLDTPELAPEPDTEFLARNGAAGQARENMGGQPVTLTPEKEPAQDELDDIQWEPTEEEPEGVEWEHIEDEPDDVEWDPIEDEDGGN